MKNVYIAILVCVCANLVLESARVVLDAREFKDLHHQLAEHEYRINCAGEVIQYLWRCNKERGKLYTVRPATNDCGGCTLTLDNGLVVSNGFIVGINKKGAK